MRNERRCFTIQINKDDAIANIIKSEGIGLLCELNL